MVDTPLIKFHNVCKSYDVKGIQVPALQDINLEIHTGEFVAVMGPSGSGKSTFLQILAALDKPTSGEVTVNGLDIHKFKDKELSYYHGKMAGIIFQSYYLQPFLTVKLNVELPLFFQDVPVAQRDALAEKAIAAVGLTDKMDYLPKQLSGGQVQRVAIARVLVNQPLMILADEPTANLDKENTAEIMNSLKKINAEQGTTIVVVTHNDQVAGYAGRVINLREGKVQ